MPTGLTWMAPQEQITKFLNSYIVHWPRDPSWPGTGYYGHYWSQPAMIYQIAPQALAEDLLANWEFRALQLGTWLNRPNVELITAAVEAIAPPPYRQDIELLVEALKLAAHRQRGAGWNRALITTGAAVGVSALLAASKS